MLHHRVSPRAFSSSTSGRGSNRRQHVSLRSRQTSVAVRAIGFDFGETPEPEKVNRNRIGNLGTMAASLLVLQPVMKGAVAEAFLNCLAATKKYQASNKDVLAAYSKFYGTLLAAGYDSWQDYLLDQLLMARDNPLARSIAQGNLEDGAPIMTALAHDLDVLQATAISLEELADYVASTVPFAGPEWLAAAASVSSKRKGRRLAAGGTPAVTAIDLDRTSKYITRPPTSDELQMWKDSISGKDHWSQAAPLVKQYWHLHGFGITSRNTTLRWVKGALDEAPDPATPSTSSAATAAAVAKLQPLSVLQSHQQAVAANIQRHCRGGAAQHMLVAGPSGTGKTWLLWDAALAAGREHGLRLVDLSGADAATIVEAARGCARYPRIRFMLVADHVDMPMRGSAAGELMAGLTQAGPGGWPENTILAVGATPTSTINLDPVVSRFGLFLTTSLLDEAQFAATLKEIAAAKTGSEEEVPADTLQEAVSWANKVAGGLTPRSASQFLARYLVD